MIHQDYINGLQDAFENPNVSIIPLEFTLTIRMLYEDIKEHNPRIAEAFDNVLKACIALDATILAEAKLALEPQA